MKEKCVAASGRSHLPTQLQAVVGGSLTPELQTERGRACLAYSEQDVDNKAKEYF